MLKNINLFIFLFFFFKLKIKKIFMETKDIGYQYLTRFERAHIIGVRADLIAKGAPTLITEDALSPDEIARKELEKGIIPILLIRKARKKKIYIDPNKLKKL